MKRLAWLGIALLALTAHPVKAAMALHVTDQAGETFDLMERAGKNVLVTFLAPAELEKDDLDELSAFLEGVAEGVKQHVEGGGAPADIDVVMVVVGDKDTLAKAAEEVKKDHASNVMVVLADPNDAELKDVWKVPDGLLWMCSFVVNGEFHASYSSYKELEGDKDEIEKELAADGGA